MPPLIRWLYASFTRAATRADLHLLLCAIITPHTEHHADKTRAAAIGAEFRKRAPLIAEMLPRFTPLPC